MDMAVVFRWLGGKAVEVTKSAGGGSGSGFSNFFATTVVVPGCTAKLGYLAGPMQYAYCGDNMASSFCERINSVAKQVLTEGRTLLSEEELEMVVVLRVNKKFMAYMKEKHPRLSGHAPRPCRSLISSSSACLLPSTPGRPQGSPGPSTRVGAA